MKLLIVEDFELTRQGILMLLGGIQDNLELYEASSISQVEAIPDKDDFRFVLLDLKLSDSQGVTTLARVKSLFPQSGIIILSATDEPEVMLECIRRGAQGFLPKSFDGKKLISALKMILAGETFYPGNVLTYEIEKNKREFEDEILYQSITERRLEVLKMLYKAKLNKVIAIEMGISVGTVKSHVSYLFSEFNVRNRGELISRLSTSEFWRDKLD